MFFLSGFAHSFYARYCEDRNYLRYEIEDLQEMGQVLRFLDHQAIKVFSNQLTQKKQIKAPLVIVVAGAEGLTQAMVDLIKELHYEKMSIVAIQPFDFYNVHNLRSTMSKIR